MIRKARATMLRRCSKNYVCRGRSRWAWVAPKVRSRPSVRAGTRADPGAGRCASDLVCTCGKVKREALIFCCRIRRHGSAFADLLSATLLAGSKSRTLGQASRAGPDTGEGAEKMQTRRPSRARLGRPVRWLYRDRCRIAIRKGDTYRIVGPAMLCAARRPRPGANAIVSQASICRV